MISHFYVGEENFRRKERIHDYEFEEENFYRDPIPPQASFSAVKDLVHI